MVRLEFDRANSTGKLFFKWIIFIDCFEWFQKRRLIGNAHYLDHNFIARKIEAHLQPLSIVAKGNKESIGGEKRTFLAKPKAIHILLLLVANYWNHPQAPSSSTHFWSKSNITGSRTRTSLHTTI